MIVLILSLIIVNNSNKFNEMFNTYVGFSLGTAVISVS